MDNSFPGLFVGRYEHTLDAQCRVSLPSEWRNGDGDTELVMIPARDCALLLLPLATFMEFVGKVGKLAIANPKVQLALAYLGSESRRCRCDRQGRIALDRQKLDSIGVSKDLMLIGAVTHIRLCAPENWSLPADSAAYLNEIETLNGPENDLGGLSELLKGVLGK